MEISYYAVLHMDVDGIWVSFPDLPGCFSCGDFNNIEKMAKEAMDLYLHHMDMNKIPTISPLTAISLKENQKVLKITINIDIRNGRLFSPKVIDIEDNFLPQA